MFTEGLLVLLFLLLMRKRRNAKRSYQTDDKDIVVPRCSVELKDWHENPAFSEDDDIPGNEAEDPKVESSNVSIVPSDGMSCENPIYEINPVNDCKPNDQEKPTDVSTGDDNIDLSPKMHKSYNDEASSSFRNPLYDAVKWKEKKKDNEPNR